MTRRTAVCALVVAANFLVVAGVYAQSPVPALLRGRVTANPTGEPLATVNILLVGTNQSVRTNANGEFELRNIAPGSYQLRVQQPGFAVLEDSVRLASGDTSVVRYGLTPIATPLATVSVTADPIERSPLLADFRRRKETANGKFLTAAEIKQIGSQNLTSLVRGHIGGFDLIRHPSGMGSAFASRRAASPRLDRRGGPVNECYSSLWVNGQLRYSFTPNAFSEEPPRIEDFDVHRINALEFYRSASETPIELNVKTAACGTVVIWIDLR